MIRRLLLSLALAGFGLTAGAGQAKPAGAQGWMTTADGGERLAPVADIRHRSLAPGERPDIVVDPRERYQTMAGFGAAITDASAWLIQTKLSASQRKALLRELFSPAAGAGARFGVTRIPIGASDFSRSHYSLADEPGDPRARLTHVRPHMLPTLRAMRALNPRLTIIASPWSAPAWMKDGGSLIKGRLKAEHYPDFARYLISYSHAMRRAGVPIDMLTIQNEPHFEPEDYPGMRMEPADRARFIGDHLGPLMRASAPSLRLLDWDHNWDQPESPVAVLSDAKAEPFVDGVAWHCYAGDVSAQSLVRDRFPAKESWFTECASGDWSGDWSKSFAWTVSHLVIGTTRNWAKGVVMWNLALDETHGPHLGGCGNCRGLVTIDSATGAITREPEYYAFTHASRFVRAGAVRIGSDARDAVLENVAFQNPRDRSIVLILRNGSAQRRTVTFGTAGHVLEADMPAGAVATFLWKPRGR